MRSSKSLLLGFLLAGSLTACFQEADHCSDYVDYMCDCHDDSEYSCEDLRASYEEASLEQQNDCAVDLDNQRQLDEEDGAACESGDTGI